MAITPLPAAPEPTDSTAEFNSKAFAWVAALDTFTTQANALETNVDGLESSTQVFAGQASNSASQAAASATASANSATTALGHASAAAANTNAPLWVSGTTYAAGALVYSPITARTYRRKTAGAGTTDPSADSTNWTALFLEIDTQRPRIRPSLLLDFANVQALDSRITFARATTATYYGTRTAKAEENLFQYSQEFDNAYWSKNSTTVTANSIAAPDGTTTADTLSAAGTGLNAILRSILHNSGSITFSIYAKAGTKSVLQIDSAQISGRANFDLATGTLGTVDAAWTASIVSAGNGWYRCIATFTGTGASGNFIVSMQDSTTAAREANSTAGDLYIWGAQWEIRSTVTAYTPTTTQPISNYIPVLETAASGVARFDHSPTTFESLGLLIEQQSTNLVRYSEQLNNAAWAFISAGTAVITPNILVAPDGTITADLAVGNNAATWIGQNVGAVSAGQYTFSVWLKSDIAQTADIFMSYGSTDNLTCSVTTSWQRFTITATRAATVGLFAGVNVGNGKNIYIWGAQLEAGAFATSYIPTVASQVTRAADAASMTGTNFSSWYTQGEGTLYVESLAQNTAAANNKNLRFSDGTTSNEIWLGSGSPGTSSRSQITLGGVTYFDSNLTNQTTAGQFGKYAVSFETNNAVLCANGTLGVVDTAVSIPSSINQLTISPPQRAGYYKKIAYYPVAVTSAQLQALTS